MQNQPKLSKKKKILVAIVVLVTIIIITIGTFAVINFVNSGSGKKQSSAELKASADRLKEQAIKAQENDNDTKAVELLKQAKSQYELAGDKNNAVDAEALIHLSNNK